MSTLITTQLFDGITFSQKIRIRRATSIRHIRPWIYINGTLADGQFQCRILQGANVLKTATIDYTQINAVKTETYAHGYIRFDIDSLTLHLAEGQDSTEYTLEFSMINYTDDENNYISIVRNWDIRRGIVYDSVDGSGEPVNSMIAPAGFDIYEYRR